MSAQDIFKAITKTIRENAVQQWARLKHEHPETVSGSYSFRFPGQRGPETEIVDLPTAMQIIMLLKGAAAAKVRLKASVLLVRFLAGLTEEDFASVRITHSVLGKKGPYVAALDIIKVVTKTNKSNATQRLDKLKIDYPEVFTPSKHFQFPLRD